MYLTAVRSPHNALKWIYVLRFFRLVRAFKAVSGLYVGAYSESLLAQVCCHMPLLTTSIENCWWLEDRKKWCWLALHQITTLDLFG